MYKLECIKTHILISTKISIFLWNLPYNQDPTTCPLHHHSRKAYSEVIKRAWVQLNQRLIQYRVDQYIRHLVIRRLFIKEYRGKEVKDYSYLKYIQAMRAMAMLKELGWVQLRNKNKICTIQ